MKSRSAALLRYLAFQVPDTLLVAVGCLAAHAWLGLPAWAAGGIVALWVLKELALYPLMRGVFEDRPSRAHALVGLPAEASEDFTGEGYVRARGELWRARVEGGGAVAKGEAFEVVGQRGLTLTVRRRPEA